MYGTVLLLRIARPVSGLGGNEARTLHATDSLDGRTASTTKSVTP